MNSNLDNKRNLPVENYEIEEFNPVILNDFEWNAYFKYSEKIYKELNPGRQIPNRSRTKNLLLDPIYPVQIKRWVIWDLERENFVAFARLYLETPDSIDYDNNKHIAFVYLTVDKEIRGRKKLGTKLFRHLVQESIQSNIKIIQTEVETPSGVAFCYFYAGDLVHQEEENVLYFDDINWKLLDEWIKEGLTRLPQTTIEVFERVPIKYLEEFCKIYSETVNQRPTGDMEQDIKIIPNTRRIEEERYLSRGYKWLTMISKERDGHISGLTEVYLNPSEKYKLIQGLTGVRKKYREKGLGKFLKAKMVYQLYKNFPNTTFISTGNARDNVPIVAINKQIGFKLHSRKYIYKWYVDELCIILGIEKD